MNDCQKRIEFIRFDSMEEASSFSFSHFQTARLLYLGGDKQKIRTNFDNAIQKQRNITFLGVYWGASWCPPCKYFSGKLKIFYEHLNRARISTNQQPNSVENKVFEVVFISADNNEKSFLQYYQTMPWLATTFQEGLKFKKTSYPCFSLFFRNPVTQKWLELDSIDWLSLLRVSSLKTNLQFHTLNQFRNSQTVIPAAKAPNLLSNRSRKKTSCLVLAENTRKI